MGTSMNSALDNLATNGVINFDADAFLKGTKPRYVGSPEPELYMPGDQPLLDSPNIPVYGVTPGAQLKGQPSRDAFVSHEGAENSGSISIKTALTAGIIGVLGIFTGSKIKSKFGKQGASVGSGKAAARISTIKDKISNTAENLASSISAWAGKGKAPEAAETAKAAKETVKSAAETIEKKKGIPKPVKIGALVVAGALGLYEIYRAIKERIKPAPQE